MEKLISKELLLELKLFDNIENREWRYEVNINTLRIIYNITNCFSGNWFTINIYELAHKCKEWAIGEHGLSLHSFPCPDDTYTCEIYKFHKSTGYVIVDWFNCLSENEAIFESCEWILKND